MDTDRVSFQNIIHNPGCGPLVFSGVIDSWSARKWTPCHLANLLGDRQFQCKLSSIDHSVMQYETECVHMMVTLSQYHDWLSGTPTHDNPLTDADPAKVSCYIDYKYMKQMFIEQPDVLKSVDWGMFGLTGRDGADSTIWIGSTGAYTPCHQDTYGFNLVAQIYGRKRWYLFDPQHTCCMYPTRLPYEESSIFSEVNIRSPDLLKHPLFKGTKPYIVELLPGDVLYVPRHWWHFVECLQSSISINTWVPLESDIHSHVQEAISRLVFTSLSSTLLNHKDTQDFVNTNEELQPPSVNIQYVQMAVQAVITKNKEANMHSATVDAAENDKNDTVEKTESLYDSSTLQTINYITKKDNFESFAASFQQIKVVAADMSGIKVPFKGVKKRKLDESIDTDMDDCDKVSLKKLQTDVKKITEIAEEHKSERCRTMQGNRARVCDLNNIKIYSVQNMSFKEFLQFLEKVFEYEIISRTSNGSESSDKNNVSGLEECDNKSLKSNIEQVNVVIDNATDIEECKDIIESEPKGAEKCSDTDSNENVFVTEGASISVEDIINSILDPEVVKHISHVLINKVRRK